FFSFFLSACLLVCLSVCLSVRVFGVSSDSFYSRAFEKMFQQCLALAPQSRYSISFPLLCTHFMSCTHELCPEEVSQTHTHIYTQTHTHTRIDSHIHTDTESLSHTHTRPHCTCLQRHTQ